LNFHPSCLFFLPTWVYRHVPLHPAAPILYQSFFESCYWRILVSHKVEYSYKKKIALHNTKVLAVKGACKNGFKPVDSEFRVEE
jgi:hypothetical protein